MSDTFFCRGCCTALVTDVSDVHFHQPQLNVLIGEQIIFMAILSILMSRIPQVDIFAQNPNKSEQLFHFVIRFILSSASLLKSKPTQASSERQ